MCLYVCVCVCACVCVCVWTHGAGRAGEGSRGGAERPPHRLHLVPADPPRLHQQVLLELEPPERRVKVRMRARVCVRVRACVCLCLRVRVCDGP